MKARIINNINLLEIQSEVIDKVQKDIKEWQLNTVANMKRDAPVKTGELSNRITGTTTNNGLTSTIVAEAPYSAYNEFGTYGSFDGAYTSALEVTNYAKTFQRSNDKSRRGTPARRYFFSNARRNFFKMIDNFKV